MNIKAILLMGGTGQRFKSDIPKQFHRLCGKKIYLHTLETFTHSNLFDEILLVCAESWIPEVIAETTNVRVIPGGATRQESSYLGLCACGPTDIVVIHDAVRPFVTKEILHANIEAAKQYQAVDTCIPSCDTLVHAPQHTHITSIPSREDYLRGQTPQSFAYPLILEAHQKARHDPAVTDDCSLVLRLPHPVHIVTGSESNIKITSELDLILAEQLCRMQQRQAIPSQSLQGKIFAITGGTGGIGQAIADLLKKEGAIALPISTSAQFKADLSSYSSATDIFTTISHQYGPLDGLINCVGFLKVKPFAALTQEEIDHQIAANYTSVVYSCHAAHLKPDAHIINIASSSYTRGRKEYAIYSSAKAAVVNFTQGLAEERPHQNINVLIPQRTNTPMRRNNFPDEDTATLLSPHDIAQEAINLLKHPTTGSIIEVRKK